MNRRITSPRVVDFPRPVVHQDVDELCINTIRTLVMDAVQQAQPELHTASRLLCAARLPCRHSGLPRALSLAR